MDEFMKNLLTSWEIAQFIDRFASKYTYIYRLLIYTTSITYIIHLVMGKFLFLIYV